MTSLSRQGYSIKKEYYDDKDLNIVKKELTVEVICEMYTRPSYSHWLGTKIEKIFKTNTNKKDTFFSIADNKNFIIPDVLKL